MKRNFQAEIMQVVRPEGRCRMVQAPVGITEAVLRI